MQVSDIHIIIADKHYLSREGFKCLMGRYSGYNVVAEVTNDDELKQSVDSYPAAVLVVDFAQGNDFSLDMLHRLQKKYPELKLLVISAKNEKHEILAALESGASGYLLKECGDDEILEALAALPKGEKFFCAQILENVLDKKSPKACESLYLTPRELEIVQLVAKGFSTHQIAEKLCRSKHTINTHRKNIMAKLGLNKPSDLVLYAVKKGIVAA